MTMPPSQPPQQPFTQPPEPRRGLSTTNIVLIVCGVLFALLLVCGVGGFFALRSVGNSVGQTFATVSAQLESTATAGGFDIDSTPEINSGTVLDSTPETTGGIVLGGTATSDEDATETDSTPTSDEDAPANGQTVTQNSDDTQTVTASDGNSAVVVPADWSTTADLHDDAEIQASSASDEQYLIVLTENKSDFENTDLQKYGELVRDNLTKNLENSEVGTAQSLTVNGQPALQYEISGTIDDVNITYWLTAVEGTDHFYQVLTWTLQSKASANRDALQQVATSFRETE